MTKHEINELAGQTGVSTKLLTSADYAAMLRMTPEHVETYLLGLLSAFSRPRN